MAVRPFAPTGFGINPGEFYAQQVEARLLHSGEYVRHLPIGAPPQWVVLNYQHIPIDGSITPDYALAGTNPRAWGLLPHFETQPRNYIEGNSVREHRGSQFEIRGLIFNVKSLKVNHRGGLHCELDPADNCAEPRAEFFIERDALLCLNEQPCADM